MSTIPLSRLFTLGDTNDTTLSGSFSAGATSLNVFVTSVTDASAIKIAYFCVKGDVTISTVSAGWTKLAQDSVGVASPFTVAVFYADGSAGACEATWTGSFACLARMVTYSTDFGSVGIGASSVRTSTGFWVGTTGITTTEDDAIVLSLTAINIVNAYNSTDDGFTEVYESISGTAAISSAIAEKALPTSGSASGDHVFFATSSNHVGFQIELFYEEAPAPTGLETYDTEVVAWAVGDSTSFLDSEVIAWVIEITGLQMSDSEVIAWVRNNTGIAVPDSEIIAWLRIVLSGRRPLYVN